MSPNVLASLAAAALFLAAGVASAGEPQRSPVVFAASSLADVLPKIAAAFVAQGGAAPQFRFDATSRLASQLRAGARADLFLAADREWMDVLVRERVVDPASVLELLGNSLVVVTPADARNPPAAIADLAEIKRLALAVENVPAGRYARAALRSAGVWEAVAQRLANGVSVRQTLELVASGDVAAGLVYATDARTEPRVKVAFAVDAGLHPAIVFPAALTTRSTASAEAAALLRFCRTPAAAAIFRADGFATLGEKVELVRP